MYRPGQMAAYLREHGFDVQKVRYRHAFQSAYWLLRCTFGKNNENRLLPRTMWRFINWYHGRRPRLFERIEAVANLVAGKDMVHYTRRLPAPAGAASPNGHVEETHAVRS
jgi:hypothetical protein